MWSYIPRLPLPCLPPPPPVFLFSPCLHPPRRFPPRLPPPPTPRLKMYRL